MSKKNTKTSVSKATDVAEDVNHDSDLENIIRSEFVIVSSEKQAQERSSVPGSDECSIDLGKRSTEKKTSSRDQHRRRVGPNAKQLSLLKQLQEDRINAELEADEEAKRVKREEEEYTRKQEEKARLEEEYREKIKENERQRIQRQREDGSYLTKKQRKKFERAQIQLGAAGIDIPTRHTSHLATSHNGELGKKRILYEDQRKTSRALSNLPTQSAVASVESKNHVLVENEDSSEDVWEHISDQVDEQHEEFDTLSTTEDSDDDDQLEVITDSSSASEPTINEQEEEEDNGQSLPSLTRVYRRLERYHNFCESRRSFDELRAPVICVLGHVDAGKTTLLDNLRRTHVQADEAGGITQQIGATNVPLETIRERTKMCQRITTQESEFVVPGFLIIDTPGHETFKNLRSRGSSLCDLAILVVDIMHGLAPQTIESIQLLTERKTPFIIALNKIDLLYGWKSNDQYDIEEVVQQQNASTRNHFERQCNRIVVQFAEQGLNVALSYQNLDPNEYYSMVPTSARSSDGMGSLIALIIEKCQTTLLKRITYTDELQATVMEVKTNDVHGTTIDVALVNGCLSVGDKIILAGQEAPIVTRIRGLLIPQSNQELRVTNQYQTHQKVKGACGIKILAQDLEKSMAGLPLFVVREEDEIEYFQIEIGNMLKAAINSIQLKDKGVYVQASTLGSLEAFLELLKTSHIPYAGVNIGPVHRKDVIRASAQLEKDAEWATILAFDVRIEKDAQEHANTIGVKILQNDEIYRLRDLFQHHREQMKKVNQDKYRHLAVFPCKLKILPHCVFNQRDPIICGVRVEDGFIRLGTPICVPSNNGVNLGRIVSIEKNHKSLETTGKGAEVCIKIESTDGDTPKMYGRHFDEHHLLISRISRESIDILKAYFRDEMQASDWKLIIELKKVFQIL